MDPKNLQRAKTRVAPDVSASMPDWQDHNRRAKHSYVGSAIVVRRILNSLAVNLLKVVTRCTECSSTHKTLVCRSTLHGSGPMYGQSWCYVDVRNIRRTFMVVRR
jgi:hypothetical protein